MPPIASTGPHGVSQVIDRLLVLARRDRVCLTPPKLRCMLYLCYGWELCINNRRLFDDAVFEAWSWGPNILTVSMRTGRCCGSSGDLSSYESYAHILACSSDEHGADLPPLFPPLDENATAVIDTVWRKLGSLSPAQLSNMIADNGLTPRSILEQPTPSSHGSKTPRRVIPDAEILRCFSDSAKAERSQKADEKATSG